MARDFFPRSRHVFSATRFQARAPRENFSSSIRSLPNFYRGHAPHERPIISLDCSFLVRGETVAGWVEQPWIVVGALHAGEQTKSFAGKLSGGQRAGVREGTVGLTLLVARLFPILEVSERREFRRCLHPFDHLQVERVRIRSDELTEFFHSVK